MRMSKTSELLNQKHLNDLKKNAVKIYADDYENRQELWEAMSDSAKYGPVQAINKNSKEDFVVEQNASYREIVQAYFDQTQDYTKKSKKSVFNLLYQTETIAPKKRSYREAAEANLVLTAILQYPQDAEKISTLQLMGAHNYFTGLNNNATDAIEPVLNKSIEKYMAGEETFPPTLQNYEHIRLLHGYMFHSGQCDEMQADKLLQYTEEKILKDPDMLAFASNQDLHTAYLLARKHEKDDVLGKITQKIAKEKAISGNTKS